MRKTLLLSLMVGMLPLCSQAKDGPAVLNKDRKLHFLENKGQIKNQDQQPRTDIQFSVAAGNAHMFIGNGEIHYQFSNSNESHDGVSKTSSQGQGLQIPEKRVDPVVSIYRMDVSLVGADKNAQVVKEEVQSFVTRFNEIHRTGRNQKVTDVQTIEAYSYDRVTYKNVYPNIDWVIYSKGNQLKYDFVVRPGGNVSDIKLKYSGTEKLSVNRDGSLLATTALGSVTEQAPISFQSDGKVVASSFNLEKNVLSFNVAQYEGTLTIDPSLTWGTYYGFTGYDEYSYLTVDAVGNVYAAGYTTSDNFISTDGSLYFGGTVNGYDGFISSFDNTGSLNWTTYWNTFGGDDNLSAVAVSGSGLYLCGSSDDLGDFDAYILAYTTAGTYDFGFVVGDFADDYGNTVTTDNAGNIYYGGRTGSATGISSIGAYQANLSGAMDGFIIKLDNTGASIWSTYYGGPGNDAISTLRTQGNNLYVAGGTTSTSAMATVGQMVFGGLVDVYLAQFNLTTGMRNWGTYIGGTGTEDAGRLAVNGNEVYVGSYTTSTTGISTPGTAQQNFAGVQDGFLVKYNDAGVKQWGTYYGGTGDESINGVAIGSGGNVLVGGGTFSGNLNTTNGYQVASGGLLDGFMAKFNSGTGTMVWGSYYGSAGSDRINSIAAATDDNNAFYVCGISDGTSNIATPGSAQDVNLGGIDAFLSRFCDNPTLVGPITGSSPVCAGSSQTYTIPVADNATAYTWTLPGGWTGTSTTNSITTTVGTTGGTISVQATNSCGSSATITLAVTVNPIPTATITPAGPTTFCDGDDVVLNASTGTGYSYAWFEGTNPVGTNSSSYTATTSGSYTVEITANGCSATSTAVTVTANPLPDATAGSNSVVCVGQALNLTGNSTTTGAAYSWAGPGGYTSGMQNPIINSAQPTDAGVYTLTVTANGCTQTATTTVGVATAAPAAPASINGDITICANSTGNVYDVVNDPNVSMYNWTLPTGWSGTSTTNSISTDAGGQGNVTIEVTAENGCGVSAPATLNVTVNPPPVAAISQSVNTLSTTAVFATYQWYDASGPIAGATGQSYTATASGTYYCIVTDVTGCEGTSNSITITLGVNNVTKQSSVDLYPNPNNGSFTIEGIFASNDGKASVVIMDIAGRIVYEEQVSVRNSQLEVHIGMNAGLSAGVYTIKLSSDVANTVIPFVKN